MRVVYPICCGVDVHKSFLVATLITTDGIVPTYRKKRFSTFNNSILAFKQWLIEYNCFDVCMESTGKYYVPIYNLLEDTIRVTVANPKWVSAVKGNKDDIKDSKWIGDLFRRPRSRQLYPGKEGSRTPRVYPLPLQAGFLQIQRKEPLSERLHCMQRRP